jgi:hypothetical protein
MRNAASKAAQAKQVTTSIPMQHQQRILDGDASSAPSSTSSNNSKKQHQTTSLQLQQRQQQAPHATSRAQRV